MALDDSCFDFLVPFFRDPAHGQWDIDPEILAMDEDEFVEDYWEALRELKRAAGWYGQAPWNYGDKCPALAAAVDAVLRRESGALLRLLALAKELTSYFGPAVIPANADARRLFADITAERDAEMAHLIADIMRRDAAAKITQ